MVKRISPYLFLFLNPGKRKRADRHKFNNMNPQMLSLKILPDRMAVCRFAPTAQLPEGLDKSGFYSITRTEEELTVVCAEASVPSRALSEGGWRCFKIQGPLDFSETGIIFSLSKPLAESGIPVFVVSTFDTDYFMVKEKDLVKAIEALTAAGHQLKE